MSIDQQKAISRLSRRERRLREREAATDPFKRTSEREKALRTAEARIAATQDAIRAQQKLSPLYQHDLPPGVRTYLRVPFADKDEAKALGAKWDPGEKSWYVQYIRDYTPFARWLPGGRHA